MKKIHVDLDVLTIGLMPGSGNPGEIPSNLDHEYSVPYERNDDYIKRQSENNPYSPLSSLEPELHKTYYADVDHEYNYYNERYENGIGEMISDGLADENILPSLNYFLLRNNEMFDEDEFNKLFAFSDDVSNSNIRCTFLYSIYFRYGY